jgi:serine/threonine protein phosphatase PrpC
VTEAGQSLPHGAAAPTTPGPTFSLSFNRGKLPDQGEDSDPILREGRDLALLGVFDGMGGAGGTVYETPEGPRTGAYLASRVARDVVERRMVELLEPDWFLDGRAAADDLQRSVKAALEERLALLNAPRSGLRSKLLRALPTTMALVALQRTQAGGQRWVGHVLWAGDSRAYVFDADGAHQLSADDLRDQSDAMANLRQDSVVSNAMSADTDFRVHHRRVELQAPFIVACATDGCFGYVRSPMHFEHLVLHHLADARSARGWSAALEDDIAATTGDDAAMCALAVGADLAEMKRLLRPRLTHLEAQFLEPLDTAVDAVAEAEAALAALRRRASAVTAEVWQRYKPEYERYLQQPEPEEEPEAEIHAGPAADAPSAKAGERIEAVDPPPERPPSGSPDDDPSDDDPSDVGVTAGVRAEHAAPGPPNGPLEGTEVER